MKPSRTDFNDLQREAGKAVVLQQLEAAWQSPPLESAVGSPRPSDASPRPERPPVEAYDDAPSTEQDPPDADGPPDTSSPHPSDDVAPRFLLDELLQRFSLAMPDGKVWDAKDSRLIRKGAARDWWGEKAFKEWLAHERRATVQQDDVQAFAAAAQARGRGGLAQALDRYIYVYPTDYAWDVSLRERVPVARLKIAIADVYESWLKHPSRRQMFERDLVFDPGGPLQADGRINTFRGLPLEPLHEDERCGYLVNLILHLCNGDHQVFDWLVRWLAYPLQHVGAKMATAVLVHSETQGTGKSLLFEEAIKSLYGEYGATLGQHQLESQYTDWRSGILFALFEEIFSRESKFSHTGTMKQMITGKTQRIEKKFVSGWEEANHMNAVFLSNEVQPFPVEPSDRRMLVIWPLKKLPDELRRGVLEELANEGARSLYGWLMRVDLTGFNTHTEPPMTEAKERLIDYSRFGWDLFHRDWKAERTPWPYQSCTVEDLYKCYRRWCTANGEREQTLHKFSGLISTRERRLRDVEFVEFSSVRKATVLVIGSPPDGLSRKAWLGEQIETFRHAMKGSSE